MTSRVSLVLGLAVVLPILGSAAVFTQRSRSQREDSVQANILTAASRLCDAADQYIDKHRRAIEALAAGNSGEPLRPHASLDRRLSDFHRTYPGFLTLLAAGADGRIVSASPLRAPDGTDFRARLTRVSDREYFIVPMRDGLLYISEAFLGRGFGRDPIVAISAPVRDERGAITGIVEGSLDVGGFRSLGRSVSDALAIEYVLVDTRDRVIFSNADPPLAALSPVAEAPLVQAASRHRGDGVFTYAAAGGAGEGSELHMAARCLTTTGWRLFATQSLAPLARETARQYVNAAASTLFALILALAVAAAIARSITRPLAMLSNAVGAFHPHGAVPSLMTTGTEPSEVALLLDRFNEMAHRVNESDRLMHDALEDSRRLHTELTQVLADREREVQQRTAELSARTEELATANARLEQLAGSDALTGIANRRALLESIALAWRSATRERVPVSVLTVDVDHFKAYNDTLGHPAGDACLRRVAHAIESMARRPLDRAGRTGGEEFVVVLYDAAPEAASRVAENLRKAVEALEIPHPGVPGGRLTVSVGVATTRPDAEAEPSVLLERSDEALYDAKRSGRNRVAVSHPAVAAAL